ncbi:hypothetical protein [Polyangium aurulentum]|uniref:hypothetical protein n=1 Tax=Polyangium aurulentum TaxID=2567896 RepID=UPI0010AECDF4|nr:hypothetical protein [Polyangium aurulentum]UQA56294.1 hypothetical protein E8A73_034000 [Polyangium aurulentum]
MMKERLTLSLTVNVGGADHPIPGGDVRGLSLTMTSHGVEGWVEFVVQDDSAHGGKYKDEVLADFVKPDLGTVNLSFTAAHWDSTTEKSLPAIATSGIIIDKSVVERVFQRELKQAAVLFRVYRVRFADPASVLWRQHFPCDLFTQKTMQAVIDAHKGASAAVSYDWDALTAQRELVFFHLDPDHGASFYDFVMWFVARYEGVFSFDHAQGTYAITKAKDTSGEVKTLPRDDVAEVRSVFPQITRSRPRVLNSYTESPATRPVDGAQAASGIFRDVLLRTPIAQDVDDRVTLETSRSLAPSRELSLDFARFPTVAIVPGSLVDISKKGGFSSELLAGTEPFRVYHLRVEARAFDANQDRTNREASTGFEVEIEARLEAKSEACPRLPAFRPPRYPAYLEGKVVSETGEDTDVTYQIYQDEVTNADIYKVKIPLFADQIVAAPFDPHQGSGTFYIPAYKNARVLVALDFDRVWIDRLLDWRDGARVPQSGQGQQILLGSSAQSNTSVLHDYESDAPVFRILRTNAKDTAMLRIEEGAMILQVKETEGE